MARRAVLRAFLSPMKTGISTSKPPPRITVQIPTGHADLEGELTVPPDAPGVVLFAHGSGSSRHSPRNQHAAEVIRAAGFGTLLFDLLTHAEEQVDQVTYGLRFDIDLLARRLMLTTQWLETLPETQGKKLGYFGASTGAAAALMAAAELGERIAAVVSRGGRPDLAGHALPLVCSPTLLIVGGQDVDVLSLNEEAYAKLVCEKSLRIVPGASHLFEEPGKLDQAVQLSVHWFTKHMGAPQNPQQNQATT